MTELSCPDEDCEATFNGPRAHIDVVDHVSAVHIHGEQKSPPCPPYAAEPTDPVGATP